MTLPESRALAQQVNSQISAIIRGQQKYAGINDELAGNQNAPFEQDFIYADHYGRIPSEPRTHNINGVQITTRILHQTGTGLRDISGGDLLYQIDGVKFGIVQYKRPDFLHRVQTDAPQLDTLIEACPLPCQNKNFSVRVAMSHHQCGSYYCIRDEKSAQYVRACVAKSVFGSAQSRGVSKFRPHNISPRRTVDSFNESFAMCEIGAPIDIDSEEEFVEQSVRNNRLVFLVNQSRRFSSR